MKLALLIACMFFVNGASAQSQTVTMGGRYGLTFSDLVLDPKPEGNSDWKSVMSFAIGGELNLWLTPQFAIAPQVLYVSRVSEFEEPSFDGFSFSNSILTRYLELPIYAKLQLGDEQVRPYIFAGPSIGLLLSATSRTTRNGKDEDMDAKDDFSDTEIGLQGGVGIRVQVDKNTELIADAGYHYGLTDLTEAPVSTLKHRGFRIMTGALFKL
jgi:hypothetical protein